MLCCKRLSTDQSHMSVRKFLLLELCIDFIQKRNLLRFKYISNKKILLKIITYPQRNCSVQNVCKQAWHDRRPKHFLFCVLTFELYVTRRANVRCHASKLSNEFSKYEIKSAYEFVLFDVKEIDTYKNKTF